MKRYFNFLFLLLFSTACSIQSFAATQALDIYHQANIAYQQKEYSKAIEFYESILSNGKVSPELYYNLANAYYKNDNVPYSILNFERALKMDPKDEDAQFNLKIASLKVIDKIDPVPQIFYKRWLDSVTRLFTPDSWSKILIILLWCSLLSSLIYLFGASVNSRKTGFILSLSLLILFSVSFVLAAKSHSGTYSDKSAIVMSASVYVKSSPDPKGNDLFIIHEGTKVELLDEINEWKKIRLLNGSIGWLMTSEIEII